MTRYQHDAIAVAPLRAPVDLTGLLAIADAIRLGDADGSKLSPVQLDTIADFLASATGENRGALRSKDPVYLATRFSLAVRTTARADASEDDEVRERRLMVERAGGRRSDAGAGYGADEEARERTAMINRTKR